MDADLVHFRKARLLHAFHVALGELAVAKATNVMVNGMPAEQATAMVDEHARELRAKGIAEAEIAEACRLLHIAYSRPPDLLPEERDGSVRLLVDISLEQVAHLWLETLHATRGKVLSDMVFLLLLDDAMLPSMDPDSQAEFDRKCFVYTGFTGDELREGLRLIRRNVGGGALLHPDAMIMLGIVPPIVSDA